jgi:hypothetical protein
VHATTLRGQRLTVDAVGQHGVGEPDSISLDR